MSMFFARDETSTNRPLLAFVLLYVLILRKPRRP